MRNTIMFLVIGALGLGVGGCYARVRSDRGNERARYEQRRGEPEHRGDHDRGHDRGHDRDHDTIYIVP
jgi:hypothetical protein